MKGLAAVFFMIICLLACPFAASGSGALEAIPDAQREGPIAVSWKEKKWNWQAGTAQTAEVTLTNTAGVPVEDLTVVLQPARADKRFWETPVWTEKNKKRLKAREQTETILLGTLEPEDTVVLTLSWQPENSLISVREAAFTMAAVGTAEGVPFRRVVTFRQEKASNASSGAETRIAGIRAGNLMYAMGGAAAAVWLAYLIRRGCLRRKSSEQE